ncbi:MAG: hypothetical protein Q3976_05720 [Corynebacterium sp.]|nr:hypothetical protein [Corynebacterium sp.]
MSYIKKTVDQIHIPFFVYVLFLSAGVFAGSSIFLASQSFPWGAWLGSFLIILLCGLGFGSRRAQTVDGRKVFILSRKKFLVDLILVAVIVIVCVVLAFIVGQ